MAGTINSLLFKSNYDYPQNTSGNKVLQLQYGFNNFITALT